jgi:hypothetical protein
LKQSPEDFSLPCIDSIKGVPRPARAFHFDNHDRLPIRRQHDEVCLIARITRTPPVPRERSILQCPKEALCGAFTMVTADPLDGHPCGEWLKPESQKAEAKETGDPDSIGGEVISQGAHRSTKRSALVVKRSVVADTINAAALSTHAHRVSTIGKHSGLHLSSLFMESPFVTSPCTHLRVVLCGSLARFRGACD